MPSLPRIRSRRAAPGTPVVETRPGPAELRAGGVTWVHLLSPTAGESQLLASRFGWHPLDIEDVLSRRQRPKVDVYTGDEDGQGGYLFTVLHFPVYDATVGRLNAGELDAFVGPDYLVTLPAVELRPVTLGQRHGDDVVVTTGVASGEQVVVTGQLTVAPGAKVRIAPRPGSQ